MDANQNPIAYPENQAPMFEPLEGTLRTEETPQSPTPSHEISEGPRPFTDEEIVDGSAFVTSYALLYRGVITPEQAEVFSEGYKKLLGDFLPTASIIKPFKLGEALAKYGIKYGSLGELSFEKMHPLARLGIGGLILGISTYMGVRAARDHAPIAEAKEEVHHEEEAERVYFDSGDGGVIPDLQQQEDAGHVEHDHTTVTEPPRSEPHNT